MAHTPGPWQYNKLEPDGNIIKRHGTFEISTPNYDVCTVTFTGGPIRKEDDASLIAAAPDLLAACEAAYKELMDWFMRTSWGDGPSTELLGLIWAAIAKAKGEE